MVQISPVYDEHQQQVHNDFDCPVFRISYELHVFSSSKVICSVSFVHECTSTCKFTEDTVPLLVEREVVEKSKLIFCHDKTNRMYCFNNFCMNQ